MQLVASVLVAATVLVPGAALGRALLGDFGGTPLWTEAMADQTADVVAALPFATLEAMDQGFMLDWRVPGEPDFRVDFTVNPVSTGLRVHATLVDNRTRETLKDFVAWRGRT